MPKKIKDPSNAELLKFIKKNVATKTDLKGFATKEDLKSLATKTDLRQTQTDLQAVKQELKTDVQRVERKVDHLQTSVDNLGKGVQDLRQEKTFRDRRIARVEYRTESILGPKVQVVDAEFEEQYHPGG